MSVAKLKRRHFHPLYQTHILNQNRPIVSFAKVTSFAKFSQFAQFAQLAKVASFASFTQFAKVPYFVAFFTANSSSRSQFALISNSFSR